MDSPVRKRYDLTWRRRHLPVLIVVCAVASGVLALAAMSRPCDLGESIGAWPDRRDAAREWIDPNTASAASLQRIPGVGPKTAQEIIAYARKVREAGGEKTQPFTTWRDLDRVPGIGLATARRAAPYMRFPALPDPTSRP